MSRLEVLINVYDLNSGTNAPASVVLVFFCMTISFADSSCAYGAKLLWKVRFAPHFIHRVWMGHRVSNFLYLPLSKCTCLEVEVYKHCFLPVVTL